MLILVFQLTPILSIRWDPALDLHKEVTLVPYIIVLEIGLRLVVAFSWLKKLLTTYHGEMNRFLMTKTTREMRVVPSYDPNIPSKVL